jgi:hypothetical protein
MEFLRKLGPLARQHYEKIALILAVIVLALAAAFLVFKSRAEAETVQAIPTTIERARPKAVPLADLQQLAAVVKTISNPPALNLSSPHKVFNPVKWQAWPDGQIIKVERGDEVGPKAATNVNIRPLLLTVWFNRASTAGTNTSYSYYCSVTNLAARANTPRADPAIVNQRAYTLNDTNKPYFILREAQGAPGNPTNLIAELRGSVVVPFSFGPDKPWSYEMEYEADFFYPVTRTSYKGLRKGSVIKIENEDYKIIDITRSEILLSDPSNVEKIHRVTEKVSP